MDCYVLRGVAQEMWVLDENKCDLWCFCTGDVTVKCLPKRNFFSKICDAAQYIYMNMYVYLFIFYIYFCKILK